LDSRLLPVARSLTGNCVVGHEYYGIRRRAFWRQFKAALTDRNHACDVGDQRDVVATPILASHGGAPPEHRQAFEFNGTWILLQGLDGTKLENHKPTRKQSN